MPEQLALRTGRVFKRDVDGPLGKFRGYFLPEIRAEKDGEGGAPRVTFILSTGGVKRDGNVIDQKGWELGNYRKNPQVLWCHDYSGRFSGIVPTIGRSEREWLEGDALRSEAQFLAADMGFPAGLGHAVGRMVQDGYLNAVSVGWDPLEWTYDEQIGGYRFIRQELLEYSVVPIPADPDALAQRAPLTEWARKRGVDLRPYREELERGLDGEQRFATATREQLERAWRECAAPRSIFAGREPKDPELRQLIDAATRAHAPDLRGLVRGAMQS